MQLDTNSAPGMHPLKGCLQQKTRPEAAFHPKHRMDTDWPERCGQAKVLPDLDRGRMVERVALNALRLVCSISASGRQRAPPAKPRSGPVFRAPALNTLSVRRQSAFEAGLGEYRRALGKGHLQACHFQAVSDTPPELPNEAAHPLARGFHQGHRHAHR
jgi:hypothetical protein